jgi:hypothetical protein
MEMIDIVMAFGRTKMKWEGEQPLFLIESSDNQQGLDPNDRQQLRPLDLG